MAPACFCFRRHRRERQTKKDIRIIPKAVDPTAIPAMAPVPSPPSSSSLAAEVEAALSGSKKKCRFDSFLDKTAGRRLSREQPELHGFISQHPMNGGSDLLQEYQTFAPRLPSQLCSFR